MNFYAINLIHFAKKKLLPLFNLIKLLELLSRKSQ